MNRLVRGLITGSLIGAGVGIAMLVMNRRNGNLQSQQIRRQTRSTVGIVKDNAIRLTSAVKNGTEAISRRLARRSS